MICFETCVISSTLEFFKNNLKNLLNVSEINYKIKNISGINNFFTSQEDATRIVEQIKKYDPNFLEYNRKEYGDFQTNKKLSLQVAEYAFLQHDNFEFILEPTCGKGNLILSAIKQSQSLKKVVGIEIYKPYVWETKFKILTYYLLNKNITKPEIDIFHENTFKFDYKNLAKLTSHLKTLVIGNPPWVTNAELGSTDSKNVPQKSNFKKYNGIEAITGKGNFDIGEYISLMMLKYFENHNGIFTFLLKNSVVKNIIQDQKRNSFNIGKSKKLNINAKKEFNASVNACLFLTHLNIKPDYICKEFDFYNQDYLTTFGWNNDKFVYSIKDYNKSSFIDGKSIFTWRSGVKHDCSKVMELEQINGYYINGLKEKVNIEKKLIFGLLKSSDLKSDKINTFRKSTIITQKKVGQETKYIQDSLPLTYQYLSSHKIFFEKRKSSIYNNKPDFSIFGIGNYSFAKYKIAISGFYKTTCFTLVSPNDSKAIMLDDTCYFIGFDNLKMAQIAYFLLNSDLVQKFLKSIIFLDSKRSINKDILMRIDFKKVFENYSFSEAKDRIPSLKVKHWNDFRKLIQEKIIKQ